MIVGSFKIVSAMPMAPAGAENPKTSLDPPGEGRRFSKRREIR
jgi:hypothetical protein